VVCWRASRGRAAIVDFLYASEKFYSALHYAIASDASLQERLAGVMLGISHLEKHDLPDDEIWERFQKLLNATTRLPAKGKEGTIKATTSQMKDDEAAKLLQEALGLFSDIAQAFGKLHT
jgi:hypothetical protein